MTVTFVDEHTNPVLRGVPPTLIDVAEATLAGDFETFDYMGRDYLAAVGEHLSPELVVALSSEPHARVQQHLAARAAGPVEMFERFANDDDRTVRLALLGNEAVPSHVVAVVWERFELHRPGFKPASVDDYVLWKFVTHPGLDEDVLELMPAAVVALRNPRRLAAPGDPDGTAELVAGLASKELDMTLGEARDIARLTLMAPA
jgi:hypothetical protein